MTETSVVSRDDDVATRPLEKIDVDERLRGARTIIERRSRRLRDATFGGEQHRGKPDTARDDSDGARNAIQKKSVTQRSEQIELIAGGERSQLFGARTRDNDHYTSTLVTDFIDSKGRRGQCTAWRDGHYELPCSHFRA